MILCLLHFCTSTMHLSVPLLSPTAFSYHINVKNDLLCRSFLIEHFQCPLFMYVLLAKNYGPVMIWLLTASRCLTLNTGNVQCPCSLTFARILSTPIKYIRIVNIYLVEFVISLEKYSHLNLGKHFAKYLIDLLWF